MRVDKRRIVLGPTVLVGALIISLVRLGTSSASTGPNLSPGPLEDKINTADLVCIGTADEAVERENGTLEYGGPTLRGKWTDVKFHVQEDLKGSDPKEITIRVFVSAETWTAGPNVTPPVKQRCVVFLRAIPDKPGQYNLLDQTGPIISLSAAEDHAEPDQSTLERLGSEILKAAQDENPVIAVRAIRWSAYVCDAKTALPILADLSKAKTASIQLAALAARLRLHDSTALAQLADLSDSIGTHADMDSFAASHEIENALSNFNAANSIGILVRIVAQKNAPWHEGASMALRDSRDPVAVPALIKLLNDPDQKVQYNAVMGLANFTTASNGPTYKNFIADKANYLMKCKDWWEREGKAKYGTTSATQPQPAPATQP